MPVKEMAQALGEFFRQIPSDTRYHKELRTDLYLRDEVFNVLAKYSIGQVLSHWTWVAAVEETTGQGGHQMFQFGE